MSLSISKVFDSISKFLEITGPIKILQKRTKVKGHKAKMWEVGKFELQLQYYIHF